MENLRNCQICGNQKFSNYITTRDYFLSQEDFSIVRCSNCGFLYTHPRPDLEALHRYYQSEEYISHSTTNKNLLTSIYIYIRKQSIKTKIALLYKNIKPNKALDFGCGTGEFLYYLSKKGIHTKGIELNESARSFATENYNLKIYKSLETLPENENNFDAITLWHSLEHVYNLNSTLDKIKSILNKEGILIIAVPNFEAKDAKLYGKFWAAYDVPRHLYHFNKNSIELLLRNHGFRLKHSVPLYFDAFYVSLLSEKYKKGKYNYLKAFRNGLLSNWNAFLNNKEYSSIIYIFDLKENA